MATKILAANLAPNDVIGLGGAEYRVAAVRRDGALVVAVLPRFGTATFSPDHPIALVSRKATRMPLRVVTGTAGSVDLRTDPCGSERRSEPRTTRGMDPAKNAAPAAAVTHRPCDECGAPLLGRRDRRFCSGACRVAAHRRRERRAA
jgi:hypothetical protein